jgi:hypothetical protein
MKFVNATLSLLVLLTLSGSMVAFVAGVSGYLPKISADLEELPSSADEERGAAP